MPVEHIFCPWLYIIAYASAPYRPGHHFLYAIDPPYVPASSSTQLCNKCQTPIQLLSYWCPRHSLNLYPSTQCVSSQYSKSLFVGSRGPRNPIHSTHCVHSLNHMVQYTVVFLCEVTVRTIKSVIPGMLSASRSME